MKYRRNTSEKQKLKEHSHRNSVRAVPYSSLGHKNRIAFDSYTGIIYEGNQQVIPFYIMDSIESLFKSDKNANQKQVLHLYFQEKKTIGEIAALLKTDKQIVSRSIKLAIKKMKAEKPHHFKICAWHFGEFSSIKGTESFAGSRLIRWESQNGVVEHPSLGNREKNLPQPRTLNKHELT